MTVTTSSLYQSSITNSSILISQIYSLTNNAISINIINPTSTTLSGDLTLSMFSAGYLTASGNITISTVDPVFLGLTATSSNRVVGSQTTLTLNLLRVNPFSNEQRSLLHISSSLYNTSAATYNGNPLTLPLLLPITTTQVVINGLFNLLSIPNNPTTNGLRLITIDSSNNTVSLSPFASTALLPNKPASGLTYSFIRSNLSIGGTGTLTLSYNPAFPSVASLYSITLPNNQVSILNNSCTSQSLSMSSPCLIMNSNSTSLIISYAGQIQTILGSVLNLEPNTNNLTFSVLNSNSELVEQVIAPITPVIQYNSLSLSVSTTSNSVAVPNTLTFRISSQFSIDAGTKLVINFPTQSFLNIPSIAIPACQISFGASTINSCSISNNSNGWVSQINTTAFSSSLPPSTLITFTVTLVNAWTSTPFNSNALTVYASTSSDSFLSQGIFTLFNAFSSSSLTTITFNNISLTQSTSTASSNNTISIRTSIAVPLPIGAQLMLSLPKNIYSLPTNMTSSLPIIDSSSNSTYNTMLFSFYCNQSFLICLNPNTSFTLTLSVINNQYFALTQLQNLLQIVMNSNPITSSSVLSIPFYTPQPVSSLSLSRSNNNANQPTSITISLNSINITNYSLIISPMIFNASTVSLINSPTSILTSTNSSLPFSINSSGHISISITNQSQNPTIFLTGSNSFYTPTSAESYQISIADSSFIYFSSLLTPPPLIPYNTGVNIQRITTVVGQPT